MTSKWMMVVSVCPPAQMFLNAQRLTPFFKNREEKKGKRKHKTWPIMW